MIAADAALERIADRLGFQHTPNHEPSFWLRARLVDLTCRPLPTCGHPGVMFAALWRQQVACARCAPALTVRGDESFRCDRCGVVERPITAAAAVWQGLIVSLGLCSSCARKEYGGDAS